MTLITKKPESNTSKMRSIITKSAKKTQKFSGELARKLIKKSGSKSALVVALEGELGSGKTTFIKGFSKALGVRERVLSPTFVLIHRHKLTNNKKRQRFPASHGNLRRAITNNQLKNLYHIDAYRLKYEKVLTKLGIKEIFANPKNIVLIEWADRVERAIPKSTTWIHFDHINESERKITIL